MFGIHVVTECPGVPSAILVPKKTWADQAAFDATARKLADLFRNNFSTYEEGLDDAVKQAGPKA